MPHDSNILWGAEAIAQFLGTSTAATFHLLEGGKIPARRVGRRWAADRDTLRRFFAGEDKVPPTDEAAL